VIRSRTMGARSMVMSSWYSAFDGSCTSVLAHELMMAKPLGSVTSPPLPAGSVDSRPQSALGMRKRVPVGSLMVATGDWSCWRAAVGAGGVAPLPLVTGLRSHAADCPWVTSCLQVAS
jgi:hypothetical protein